MKLFESMRTKRQGQTKVEHDDEISEVVNSAPMKDLMEFIAGIKNSEKSRKALKEDFDVMVKDSIIGSAIELIADDATQEDPTRGRLYWVEPTADCKDEEMITELNEALEAMKVDENAWSRCFNLLAYGEVFLDTHYEELTKDGIDERLARKLGLLFEIVDDNTSVADLQLFGDTVSYGVGESDDYTLYSTKQYIHIINDRGVNRETVKLTIKEGEKGEKTEEYKIRYGTSYLEAAREAFRLLDLLENILLSVRFGKSALYRLFKIEVGGASKIETSKILREFKTKLSQSEAIDKNKGYKGGRIYGRWRAVLLCKWC